MEKKSLSTENLLTEEKKWKTLVQDILQEAKHQGASDAEVGVSQGMGFSATVRMGQVETVEYHRDKSVGVTVYFGKRKGSAGTTDISPDSIKSTVNAACNFARLAGEDSYAGLADPDLLAKNYPDLNLYHPWKIDPEAAIALAKECEDKGRAVDKRITNSEGSSVSTYQGLTVYSNTNQFVGCCASSRHSISLWLVAQDGSGMQRDGYYTTARDAIDLESIDKVADEAGKRAVSRLGARRIKTGRVPIVFSAEMAKTLLGSFLGAISGGSLYRKASFLVDHLGKEVFSNCVTLCERPHIPKALGSAPFDGEGVTTFDRTLVDKGILQGYLLSSYSARKLGMKSTGNAGGAHNILVETEKFGLKELLAKMGTGLLVTELMGQGVNIVTGDYSRGATGFWVENGAIQYPVEEITIAGNLREMYKHIVAISNDIDRRGILLTGSILIEGMMVAGE